MRLKDWCAVAFGTFALVVCVVVFATAQDKPIWVEHLKDGKQEYLPTSWVMFPCVNSQCVLSFLNGLRPGQAETAHIVMVPGPTWATREFEIYYEQDPRDRPAR